MRKVNEDSVRIRFQRVQTLQHDGLGTGRAARGRRNGLVPLGWSRLGVCRVQTPRRGVYEDGRWNESGLSRGPSHHAVQREVVIEREPGGWARLYSDVALMLQAGSDITRRVTADAHAAHGADLWVILGHGGQHRDVVTFGAYYWITGWQVCSLGPAILRTPLWKDIFY